MKFYTTVEWEVDRAFDACETQAEADALRARVLKILNDRSRRTCTEMDGREVMEVIRRVAPVLLTVEGRRNMSHSDQSFFYRVRGRKRRVKKTSVEDFLARAGIVWSADE